MNFDIENDTYPPILTLKQKLMTLIGKLVDLSVDPDMAIELTINKDTTNDTILIETVIESNLSGHKYNRSYLLSQHLNYDGELTSCAATDLNDQIAASQNEMTVARDIIKSIEKDHHVADFELVYQFNRISFRYLDDNDESVDYTFWIHPGIGAGDNEMLAELATQMYAIKVKYWFEIRKLLNQKDI